MKELNANKINEEYQTLIKKGSIKENDPKVHTRIHLMFSKAQNNLKIGRAIFKISKDSKLKELLKLKDKDSFYDWVIQASYYTIFHAANALLASKKIKILQPSIHKAALYAFGKIFIINKELEDELFFIYEEAEQKALELFSTLAEEKQKRGFSAYERLSKMNIEPAEESLKNAQEFLKVIGLILANKKFI
ncbi:hypothetical protein HYX16_04955 [Candidatus Woesearchaeota archaeon]|nr:hypothetical protein [Candidatus Woesearchaeota archaeon]